MRTLVLQPILKSLNKEDSLRDPQARLEEAISLSAAIDLNIVEAEIVNLRKVESGILFGRGTIERLSKQIESYEIGLVIVNHALSPVQQRNLEKAWHCKVIDRSALILEIFGERAQTKEGKIQVELAALNYQRSRLVRSWTHLERQRGGAGFMGGPGESQIELDRRMIDDKITRLKKKLEGVKKNRDLQRESRAKVPYPIVALVGYTNAGKSTLFNKITGADVFAQDLLFATLDPTMRELVLPNDQKVILSDTVGFISELPTHLIAAFRATLEQVQYADIIIHVRDISSIDSQQQKDDVIKVLKGLGIEYNDDPRIVEVLNKIDQITEDERPESVLDKQQIALSAVSGEGLGDLSTLIANILSKQNQSVTYRINAANGAAQSWLYNHGRVENTDAENDNLLIKVSLSSKDIGRFESHFGIAPEK